MAGPHCSVCASYESIVMKADGKPVSADVKPCDAFAMSDVFREWLVGQMRKEVLSQISGAGLDRMAILKASGKAGGKAGQPSANGAGNGAAGAEAGSPTGGATNGKAGAAGRPPAHAGGHKAGSDRGT